jgi:leucyl/phenylalanyl-tRNA--protein transferase
VSNTRICWLNADDPPERFPPVSAALREPDGLLAAGGDLGADRLLYAYEHGIFPWYDEGQPLLWWSPDPRCVFLPGDFHVARRLRRALQRSTAEIRINTAFHEVILACSGPRRSEQGTWITPAMVAAYENLHDKGWAHSIEVWQSNELIGGLYGLCIGRAFFGESMFSKDPNASKLAPLHLANLLQTGHLELRDAQLESAHLLSLGATMLPRPAFIARLESACNPAIRYEKWSKTPLPAASLLNAG